MDFGASEGRRGMAVDLGGWGTLWNCRGQSKTPMVGRYGFVERPLGIAVDSQKRRQATCTTR